MLFMYSMSYTKLIQPNVPFYELLDGAIIPSLHTGHDEILFQCDFNARQWG